jgi:hypothetical protein
MVKPWTTVEVARLKELYGTAPVKVILKQFPDRSLGALCQQAHYLGLTEAVRPWTRQETEILQEMYPIGGTRACRQFLRRSRKAITDRAQLLGISCEWGREQAAPLLRAMGRA